MRAYYTLDLNEILSELPPHPVIVDLGANTEIFLPDDLIKAASAVYAVEPDPMVFEVLRSTYGSRNNVHLYNAAVGSEDGEVQLFRERAFDAADPTSASLGASVFASHGAVDSARAVAIPQIGILTLLHAIGKKVDLMKVDIEGAEVPVLETLLSSPMASRVSVILVETHEHVLPELAERTDILRKRAKEISEPKIFMNWK
jgi:FkbM family methyltransferase